jgi:carbonic anhydrase
MASKNFRSNLSRRNLLKITTGFIGTGALTAAVGLKQSSALAQSTVPANSRDKLNPEQVLKILMEGNQRFVENKKENPDQNLMRLQEVAQTQTPFAAILSCADSRVPPEIIFDQGLGDLFSVRVAGNVAAIEDIASEEYAAFVLGARLLMVLGHKRCGAVKATLEAEEVPGVISSLFYSIQPAVDMATKRSGDLLDNAVRANVMFQTEKLKHSSVLSKLVKEGKLKVVGAYYDLDNGKVTLLS